MHATAYEYVSAAVKVIGVRRRILEIGSRNVNGSVRGLFPKAMEYVGIDLKPGDGVDVVADGGKWRPADGKTFDLVVSTECLEHTPFAEEICHTAFDVLKPGGVFIVTAAGPNRAEHGSDGGSVGDEFYRNVEPEMLTHWLSPFAFSFVDCTGQDVRALAVRLDLVFTRIGQSNRLYEGG